MAEDQRRAESLGRDGSFAMGADYIPERDIKAAVWMKHFAAKLVAEPEVYRTSVEDAAEIDALVQAFRVANATCGRPITCTVVARQAKNDARKAAERLVRPAATRINRDPWIAGDPKVAIGLRPRGKRRHRIEPPKGVPVLALEAKLTGGIHIRVRDSQSSRRARPRSAAGMQLYERIIPREAADGSNAGDANTGANTGADEAPPGWRFVGVFTRTPIVVYPAAKVPGDAVSYVARWFTRRGEPGNFGDLRTVTVSCAGVRLGAAQRDHRRAA